MSAPSTIQITINYLRAAREGELRCETRLVSRGRRVANLHSRIYSGEELVASADGNYSIFAPSSGKRA